MVRAAARSAGQRGERWIVHIDDQARGRRQGCECRFPSEPDRVQLAIAVELVAEEIVENYHPWFHQSENVRQRGFIGFDDRHLTIGFATKRRMLNECRRNPPGQIRPRPVVDHLPSRSLDDIGNHPGGRGLPVRSGNHHGATRQFGGNARHHIRIDLQCDKPRRGGTATAPCAAQCGQRHFRSADRCQLTHLAQFRFRRHPDSPRR